MNKKRFTPENNPELDNRPVAELLAALGKAQGYGKAQVIFALARKSHLHPELRQVVLNEVAPTDNQLLRSLIIQLRWRRRSQWLIMAV